MKRILVLAAAGLLLCLLVPHGAWAFGVKDVVAMSKEGIPDSLIIEKIRHSGARFDLDAKDLHILKEASVSNDVILAMLRTEDRGHARGYYDRYRWPYDSPWYLGFDLDLYAPYHYGYAPIYMGRGYGHAGLGPRGHGFRRR
jgi:hypothetical protein